MQHEVIYRWRDASRSLAWRGADKCAWLRGILVIR